jgi:DNA-binding NarL/FixJ family response regulator
MSKESALRAGHDRPVGGAGASTRVPAAAGTQLGDRQQGDNGQPHRPDSESNGRGDRKPGAPNMSPVDANGSEGVWEGLNIRDPLRDESMLIIDDCTLYRENLAAMFAQKGITAPSVAWDLPSLVTALDGIGPTVVLVNIATRDSALLLRAVKELRPNVRAIVLGASEDNESEIVACAEAGVSGYHMRTDSLEDLLVLIRKVAGGETLCSPRVSAILLRRLSALASQREPAAKELALTTREAQILTMLELGRSNQDIATQLSIAVHTVKNHVHSLLTKLGVSTRAEAAALSRTIRLRYGGTHGN